MKIYYSVEESRYFTEEDLRKEYEEWQYLYRTFDEYMACSTDMGGDLITYEIEDDTDAEIVVAAMHDRLYDYIANHYWEMTKDELKETLLMAIATIYEENCSKNELIENLIERFQ